MTKQLFLLYFLLCSICGLFGRALFIVPVYCLFGRAPLYLFLRRSHVVKAVPNTPCAASKFTIIFDGLIDPSRYVPFLGRALANPVSPSILRLNNY